MPKGTARNVLTRLLFYILLPVMTATSIACMMLAETTELMRFFLYGFVPFALGGVFAMHLLLCRNPRERRTLEFIGLIGLSSVMIGTYLLELDRRSLFLSAGATLATISVIVQVKFILASGGPSRENRVLRLQESLIVPIAVAVTPFFLWLSSSLNPTYDLHLYAFEEGYGFQPAVAAVLLARAVPGLGQVLQWVYDALPLAVALLHACRSYYAPRESFLILFVVATSVGFGLYFVFPIAGVQQLFGESFPHALPPVAGLTIAPASIDLVAPRNGMPSLHAAWAYLVWFNASILPASLRGAFRGFVIVTLAATIGLPDAHWLTDLFVALPLAVALQAACSPGLPFGARERWRAVIGGALIVALWFAILRFTAPQVAAIPGLSWLLASVSCAASILLYRGLKQACAPVTAEARTAPLPG